MADKHYVYVWADGIHFNVRLEDPDNSRQCILVLMGATADGKKVTFPHELYQSLC